MRIFLIGLILLTTACRRPSRQLAATLSPADKPTQVVTRTVDAEPTNYGRYLKAGDDIIAQGDAPAWVLTVNSSKNQLRFKSATDSITVALPARKEDAANTFRYDVTTGPTLISVVFRADSCVNALTGQRADYRVEVDLRGDHYVGCGLSLQRLSRLQDIWVLTTFRGKPVAADTSLPNNARLDGPRLEISLTERRVTGTTGCNRLSGPVEADNQRILFGPLMTTKMACVGNVGRFESDFLEALSLPLTYQMADMKLTLLHDGKPIMTFKKVD